MKIQLSLLLIRVISKDYDDPYVLDQIEVIQSTLQEYYSNSKIAAELFTQGKSIEAVDYRVKVDDRPAMKALKELSEYIALEREKLMKETQQNSQFLLALLALVFLGVITLIALIASKEQQFWKSSEEKAMVEAEKKAQFLANMSHEIRTPMNGILGNSELLLEKDFKGEDLEQLELINHSASSLVAILNDILDFSKIESGKLDIENIVFDFKQVLMESLKTIEYQAKLKGIDLSLEFDERIPLLEGDPHRLKQILLNLLSNSVKFTHEGSVKVIVSSRNIDSHRVEMSLEVVDTGIGMSSQQITQIFNEYFHADTSISRNYGGTGLGIAICKSLTELMKGQISVNSNLDKGTSFKIKIPFNKTNQMASVYKKPEKLSRNYQKTVIVVEDNLINQKVAEKLLKTLGMQVYCFDSAKSFLKEYKMVKHDLILMDIQMPEMDGVECFLELKNQNYKGPVIAMTANVMKKDVQCYYDEGFDDYLPKPYDKSDLIKVFDYFFGEGKHIPLKDLKRV